MRVQIARRVVLMVVLAVIVGGNQWLLLQADVPQVATGTWAPAGDLGTLPNGTAAVALSDGRLVVAGGENADGTVVSQIGIYDPAAQSWENGGRLATARTGHTATALKDGRVLFAGGRDANGVSFDVEVYDPNTHQSLHVGDMWVPRVNHAAAALKDGGVLIVGGSDGTTVLNYAEIFNPETGTTHSLVASLGTPREKMTATLMLDGHVLVAGGRNAGGELATAELYDPPSQSFFATGSLHAARSGHVAVLLPNNNQVLIAGGTVDGAASASAELYADWRDGFTPVANAMGFARVGAIGSGLTPQNLALVAGGGSTVGEYFGYATVKTDKDDYAPGETVTITGSGWQPGEKVALKISEDADTHNDFTYEAVADANGNIENAEFAPIDNEIFHHVGMRFYLVAKGAASDALNTFTDGNLLVRAEVGGNAIAVSFPAGAAKVFNNSTCSGSPAATAAAFSTPGSGNGATNVGTPTTNSQSASIQAPSPVTISGTTYNFSSWLATSPADLTVATTGTTGCFTRVTTQSNNPAWTVTAIYVAAPTTVNTATVALNASATYGDTAVTLTATVTPASGPAVGTGTVTFTVRQGAVTVGSATTSAVVSAGSASVSYALPAGTAAGSYTIEAVYNAGTGFNGSNNSSQSPAATLTIAKANAVVNVTPYDVTYNAVAHTATGSATGVGGVDLTSLLNVSGTTHTNAGTYTDTWTFAGNTNYNASTGSVTDKIAKANADVTVTPYVVTYDAAAHTATGSASGAGGVDLTSLLDLSGTTHTNAGEYTDTWTFAGNTNFNATSGSVTDKIAKANATITVTSYDVTYDAAAHTATGSATGVGGVDLTSLLDLSGTTHTNAGEYTDTWTFAGNTNFNATSGSVTDKIAKANATITVTPYDVTYNAAAHTAAGSATGVGGVDLTSLLDLSGTTHMNAGEYIDTWTFAGNTNFNETTGSVTDKIAKANATITVTPYDVTYDAAAHTAAGSATGVGGVDLTSLLDLSATTHTNAGDYNGDGWSFAGDGNYNSASGTVNDRIKKADATIIVTPYDVTYDAAAHTAAGSASGVGGVDLTSLLDLSGTTHTNAGDYNGDGWSFAGDGNYNSASGTVNDRIKKADATISVTPYDVTYDAAAHTAAGSASGVGGVDLTSLLDLSGTTHTNAGTYTDTWTFAGNANFNETSGSVTDKIAKANATITVTPYDTAYDAAAHMATGSASGVGGVDLTSLLDLSGTTHTTAGTYTDTWTFAGNTNFNATSGSVTDKIAKANATITVTPYDTAYDAAAHTATGSASGVGGVDLTALLDLSGTTHTTAGTYTDTWTFAGNTNFNATTGSVTDKFFYSCDADPRNPHSMAYDAAAHMATGSASGVGGIDLTALLDLSGTTHTNAGTYTDTWTFAGNANFNATSGSVTDKIAKANATITVTPYDTTYNAAAHTATGSASGIGGVDLTSLLNLSGTTHTNAGDYNTDGWSFAGDDNYNSASGIVNNRIQKANATISVTPYDVIYNAAAHTATGSASGVGGVDLTSLLDLSGTTHTDAGDYNTDGWSFAGDDNYNSASGTVNDRIKKADATITVTPYDVTYDGNAHTATGSATGVNGENLSSLFNLSATTHTNVSDYNGDGWSFAGNANYNASTGTVDNRITKANATINVQGYTGAYDTNAHGAAGSATGVNGENLSALLTLGASFTNVPGGTANWTFAGDGNYNSDSGAVGIVITKATPVISWNNPTSITHPNALSNVHLNASANVGGGFVYTPAAGAVLDAGTHMLSVTFTPGDTTNYLTATKDVSIEVLKGSQAITFGALANKTFGDPAFTVTATGGASGNPVVFTSVTGTVCSVGGTGASPATVTILAVGTCTLRASQAGNSNYNAAPSVYQSFVIGNWMVQGFHQPVGVANSFFAAAPTPLSSLLAIPSGSASWNSAKGGSTIPLKFNIFAAAVERTSVSDVKSFVARKLASCTTVTGDDPIELDTAGATTLRYDGVPGSGGQFIQNWKTPTVKAEECYRVELTFQDLSVLYTFVKLKK